jgi:uncharacterized protein YbjQ (UPF0145 family)
MLMTTTNVLQGKQITAYHGVVVGQAILGANIFRDMMAGIRDIVGGRSAAYEKEFNKARQLAMDEMGETAQQLGANAVIGIDIDYETTGSNGSMMLVSVSGTAVTVE